MPQETTVSGMTTPGEPTEESVTFKELLDELRVVGKNQTRLAKLLMKPDLYNEDFYKENPGADAGEMKANIMLSVRHSEDSVMRLGKVIQAMQGGQSIFDQ